MSNVKLVVYNSVMEFANQWSNPYRVQSSEFSKVRLAQKSDAAAVTRLLNSTRMTHYHVDWRLPVDWLGDAGFVVIPKDQEPYDSMNMARMVLPRHEILACLAVTADPPPATWVRLTAVSPELDPYTALTEMFAVVRENLQETAVTEVGWLVLNNWPLSALPSLGFEQMTVIETYVKNNLDLPSMPHVPDLVIRPVSNGDFEELARLETAVFDPLWRFSQETMMIASRDATSFDVAFWGDRLVGYQISSGGRFGAHLVRLTIAPDLQGQGIGSAIFGHAIEAYRRRGVQHVTLNTQVDNAASHRLYKKFGFSATGEQMPLWVLPLAS